jgi:hypothetical protein
MFDDDARWGSDPCERHDGVRDRTLVDPRDAFRGLRDSRQQFYAELKKPRGVEVRSQPALLRWPVSGASGSMSWRARAAAVGST